MKKYDIIVRDALGFVFAFVYTASSPSAAKKQFWAKLRKIGKLKRSIRILECKEVGS